MTSTVSEIISDPISTPVPTSNARPTLTLGNVNTNVRKSLHSTGALVAPVKSVEKIPTFFIWSIFNLLLVPFGLLCCYFSHTVKKFKIQNHYEFAQKWSKRTFVINIISTLIMVGIIITIVMLHYDYVQRNMEDPVNQTRTTGGYIPWQPGR